ncbi:lytic transglycosylase domain-containing protein [Pseudalkalibacillus caeni]|uniref:lytic transglycosylase domain-containing protein n=1 Tax=Exobacillus caeni TaxID=2574798 RepID=UPI003CCC708A
MRKDITILGLIILFVSLVVTAGIVENKPDEMKSNNLKEKAIPKEYIPIYKEAAESYDVPWKLLAAVHRVETKFSTMDSLVSPKGAVGHFQFMPLTWLGWGYTGSNLGELNKDDNIDITDPTLIEKYGGYGVDASGDGKADPYNMEDAVHTAAKYLSANGASKGELKKAVYAYNHSEAYVAEVMSYFNQYEQAFEPIDVKKKMQ